MDRFFERTGFQRPAERFRYLGNLLAEQVMGCELHIDHCRLLTDKARSQECLLSPAGEQK